MTKNLVTLEQQREVYKNLQHSLTPSKLGSIKVKSESSISLGTVLEVGGQELELASPDSKRFLRFLGIPPKFYTSLSPELRSQVVAYKVSQDSDADVTVESVAGEFTNIFESSKKYIRPDTLIDVAEKVMGPEALVSNFGWYPGAYLSVVSGDLTVEPRVGDVTRAGIRFSSFHKRGDFPSVSPYLERLICSNGMIVPEILGEIHLRGKSMQEVLDKMEVIGTEVKDNLNVALDAWEHLSSIAVDDPITMVHRLAKEYELSARLESAIIDQLPSLEGTSLMDITNLITSFQNDGSLRYNAVFALQNLGGSLVRSAGGHRCVSCQHLLAEVL